MTGGPFLRPDALALLLAAPALWLALRTLDRRAASRLLAAVGPRAAALAPGLSPGRRALGRAVFAAGLLLAIAALLDPAWGGAAQAAAPRGADIVVCLDVSRSMEARDLLPGRLARAKAEIAALAAKAGGDRLALVAFAGEARLLVPLTRDAATVARVAGIAGPTTVRRGGTDLGAALDRAREAFEGRGDAPGAILLLTDGEDHGGAGARAAALCRERGVAVHCVGVGTERGGKIEAEGGGGFLRDASGAEVVSRLDPASLRALAAAGGGEYRDGARAGVVAELHERTIAPAARRLADADGRRRAEPRFQWFLLGAFLLWTLLPCTTERRPS